MAKRSDFRFLSSGSKVLGLKVLRVRGLGLRVRDLGFRV